MIGPQFPDENPPKVSITMLRQFAGLCVGIFGLLFAVSWYRHDSVPTVAAWILVAIAAFVGLPGMIYPSLVRPVYLGLVAVTRPIGHLMSLVVLGFIYYGFLTPLAVAFRLVGRDLLVRRRPKVTSYWAPMPQPSDPRRYLFQYQSQQMKILENGKGAYHGTSELSPR
jgi:hypothetical protein